jgi:two-component system sensor histidine kinase CpxA
MERMTTQNPKRYWTGIKIPLPHRPLLNPRPVLLLVESDSVTGNGFFFSSLPGTGHRRSAPGCSERD